MINGRENGRHLTKRDTIKAVLGPTKSGMVINTEELQKTRQTIVDAANGKRNLISGKDLESAIRVHTVYINLPREHQDAPAHNTGQAVVDFDGNSNIVPGSVK